MIHKKDKPGYARGLRQWDVILMLVWIMVVGGSLVWSYYRQTKGNMQLMRNEARTVFDKDVLYRQWNASHGGLYAPVTSTTQSNPYLAEVKERDIKTLSGRELTLINPAFMTRQVHELGFAANRTRGHITSLNPLRPENAPDPWEKQALEAFEQGQEEIVSLAVIDGNEYLRFMRPMITEKGCLKCHEHQGYQVGDIRGGISVSVPTAPYQSHLQEDITFMACGHALFLLMGLAGIVWRTRNECKFKQVNHTLNERVKELNCLYGLADLVEEPAVTLPEILQGLAELIPPSWQYPEVTCARIVLDNDEFKTNNFRETQWSQRADITVFMGKLGAIEVYHLHPCPELDEGPFLQEERDLLNALAERLARVVERRQTQEMLIESESRHKTLYDSSRDAIMILAPPTWKFTAGNQATIDLFQANTEEGILATGPEDVSPKYQPDGQLSSVKAQNEIEKAYPFTAER